MLRLPELVTVLEKKFQNFLHPRFDCEEDPIFDRIQLGIEVFDVEYQLRWFGWDISAFSRMRRLRCPPLNYHLYFPTVLATPSFI